MQRTVRYMRLLDPALHAGGARCLVVEGTCSSMPANAYPPPAPNIFWQITSQDPQGWDFCADPAYDQERAAQGTSSAAVLAALPANLRPTVKMTTQAGCECSPLNWTYYPSIIQDGALCVVTQACIIATAAQSVVDQGLISGH